MQASLLLWPAERSCFILSTLKHLCHEQGFWHKWRTANHLATLCHKWFTIPKPLQLNGNDLNNALLKDPALKLDIKAEKSAPNQFGIYHDKYRPDNVKKSSLLLFVQSRWQWMCHWSPSGKEMVWYYSRNGWWDIGSQTCMSEQRTKRASCWCDWLGCQCKGTCTKGER